MAPATAETPYAPPMLLQMPLPPARPMRRASKISIGRLTVGRGWLISAAVVAALVVFGIAGAMAGNGTSHTPSASPPATGGSHTSRPVLTGFGATRATWNAHHTADPNPKLIQGCCYLPHVDNPDYSDTWNLSASSGRYVDAITHSFAPGTTQARALAAVEKDDLPPDSRLVGSQRRRDCAEFAYRSPLLLRSDGPGIGSKVSVTLESAATRYDSLHVTTATELLLGRFGRC